MSEETSSTTAISETTDTSQTVIGFKDENIQRDTKDTMIADKQTNEKEAFNSEESGVIDTTDTDAVNHEIWNSITGQHKDSLNVLHQSMQLTDLTQDTTNNTHLSDVIQKLNTNQHEPQEISQSTQEIPQENNNSPVTAEREEKPAVGSPEWHKQRRENHKQVERRRRETINDGITEISKLVPGCEKNKGSILQRAAVYIRQLKDAEAATVEKWTLEKLLTDQAISELNRQVEVMKVELERIRLENSYLKRELENANGCSHLHHHEQEPKRQKIKHEELK